MAAQARSAARLPPGAAPEACDPRRCLRELLAGEPDVVEKRMVGGLAFLVAGHMAVGAGGRGGLMLRCDPDDTDGLVAGPHAHPFEMRGEGHAWLAARRR